MCIGRGRGGGVDSGSNAAGGGGGGWAVQQRGERREPRAGRTDAGTNHPIAITITTHSQPDPTTIQSKTNTPQCLVRRCGTPLYMAPEIFAKDYRVEGDM